MRKLLRAGFFRLLRLRSLWLSCLLLAGVETVSTVSRWREAVEYGILTAIDGGFFTWTGIVGFCLAIVAVFLIGPEYSAGTIRGKLICGHRRRDVFLANLLLMCASALLMCLSAVLPALALGLPLLGGFKMGAVRALWTTLGGLAMALAWSGLFTMTAMLTDHRAVAAVLPLVLAMVMLVAGVYLQARLDAKPTVQGYEMHVDGQLVPSEPTPNPSYLPEGPARTGAQFLFDLLPGAQSVQYASMEAQHPLKLTGYAAAVFLLTAAVGLALFRRKDLK